jgi:RHO1 GDP-GTP exchange protein 1/2
MYPLTIYHTSSKSSRRYTLYASSESIRERWHEALRDAIVVRRVSQEANMVR